MTSNDEGNGSGVRRYLPILGWGRQYDHSWLRGDVIAGLTVAALVVPKSLGYAGIAGVPIENGLYAAAAGTILYALFGTSRQVSTGLAVRAGVISKLTADAARGAGAVIHK